MVGVPLVICPYLREINISKNWVKMIKTHYSYFCQEMMEGDLILCIDSSTSIEAVGVVTGRIVMNLKVFLLVELITPIKDLFSGCNKVFQ